MATRHRHDFLYICNTYVLHLIKEILLALSTVFKLSINGFDLK